MSLAKKLGVNLGGIWTYSIGLGGWYCDDRKRIILKTHGGGRDMDGELLDGPPSYWLYGDGEPKRLDISVEWRLTTALNWTITLP